MERANMMNRRQLLVGAGAGGLGLIAATAMAPAAAAAEIDAEDVAGSWLVTVTADHGDFLPFQAVVAFAGGGVLTLVSADNSPVGLGTWKKTGSHSFAVTFRQPGTDQSGVPTGVLDKVIATGTHTSDHISAHFKSEVFDTSGNLIATIPGTVDGVRVEVESL